MDKAALGMFSPTTLVSPVNHSADCSTLIIIRGWYNKPVVASIRVDSVPHHPKEKIRLPLSCAWSRVM
jgi:hypothetical protein